MNDKAVKKALARGMVLVTVLGLLLWTLAGVGSDAQRIELSPRPDGPPIDELKADLGRHLFFDARLSGDTSRSCASCHQPDENWADGQALSKGYPSSDYFRNAPTVLEAYARDRFMWDGRLDGSDLATLVRDKVTEAHFMNADARLVQERLKQVPEYVEMWQAIFGEQSDPYGPMMFGVVGEFLKTLRPGDMPLDAYLAGDSDALKEREQRGLEIFRDQGNCLSCHGGPYLTDERFHRLGVPENPDIWTNPDRAHTALRFFASLGTPNYMNLRRDVGLFAVTKDNADKGKFRTPSLREVARTAPYMHNGVFATLADVVDFYNHGGGEDSELEPLGLSEAQRQDLVSFLESLQGEQVRVEEPVLPDYQARALGDN